LEVATLRAFVSYARYWAESSRLTACTQGELGAHLCFEGFGHLQAGLDAGKGVILGLPHMGSWDYAGAALGALGYPMTVVVEAGGHDALFSWFAESRRALGLSVVPLGPRAAPSLLRVLRAGGLVGLVCDRELGGGGVPVSFFGEVTNLPAGPALLALRTGAALLPTAVIDLPRGGHLGILRPPLDTSRKGALAADVARVTAGLASELEGLIRRAPEQWHLFQPNWPSDPGYGRVSNFTR
jgi:lauroyl/myristoyl acyltransferase